MCCQCNSAFWPSRLNSLHANVLGKDMNPFICLSTIDSIAGQTELSRFWQQQVQENDNYEFQNVEKATENHSTIFPKMSFSTQIKKRKMWRECGKCGEMWKMWTRHLLKKKRKKKCNGGDAQVWTHLLNTSRMSEEISVTVNG